MQHDFLSVIFLTINMSMAVPDAPQAEAAVVAPNAKKPIKASYTAYAFVVVVIAAFVF